MFLKAHARCKDGKRHVNYSLTESLRISRKPVVQRTVLNLGELNTAQGERWQRTIEAVHEDGKRQQMRLFTDREGQVPVATEDVAEVILSSLVVRRPRRFGDCWIGWLGRYPSAERLMEVSVQRNSRGHACGLKITERAERTAWAQ